MEALLLPGPALIAGSALCPWVSWDCSFLPGSRARGGGGIRWVPGPCLGWGEDLVPEQHRCSCRDSGLPRRTADPSHSWTVWIPGLGAVFTLLSTQPKVLWPAPSTCQAAQGAGPPSVSMSLESWAWAFGPARCGLTHPSQSDGPTVGPSTVADPHMMWRFWDEMGLAHGAMAPTWAGLVHVAQKGAQAVCLSSSVRPRPSERPRGPSPMGPGVGGAAGPHP